MKLTAKELAKRLKAVEDTSGIWKDLPNEKTRFLYRVWQDVNNDYDTYDSAVICADTPERAKEISIEHFSYGWADISNINVEEIGTAIEGSKEGVIIASFNAG